MEMGLGLCPAEVGPVLQLQYGDEEENEWLLWFRLAMEPITDRQGYPDIFKIGHAGRWMGTCYGYPQDLWDPSHLFVFVRPRP
jgi:hypothetical protein